jgi:hypothetical protein
MSPGKRKTRLKLPDAEWEQRFKKYANPDYYEPLRSEERSLYPSTLGGKTYKIVSSSKKRNAE